MITERIKAMLIKAIVVSFPSFPGLEVKCFSGCESIWLNWFVVVDSRVVEGIDDIVLSLSFSMHVILILILFEILKPLMTLIIFHVLVLHFPGQFTWLQPKFISFGVFWGP